MPSQLVAHQPHRSSADLCYAGVSLTVRGLVTYPENRVEFSTDCVEAGEGIDNILPLLGEDVIDELNTMAAVQIMYERGTERVADELGVEL